MALLKIRWLLLLCSSLNVGAQFTFDNPGFVGSLNRVPESGDVTPDQIPNLYSWFVSDYGLYTDTTMATPVTVDSTAVGLWTNKVVGGFSVKQTDGSKKPLYKTNIKNGKPAILFDGSNDFLISDEQSNKNQPNTTFFVFKLERKGQTQALTDGYSVGRWMHEEYPADNWALWVSSGSDIDVGGATDLNWHIWATVWNGASSKTGFDTATLTTLSGSPGANPFNGLSLGASASGGSPAQMYIAEHLWYTAAVSDANITKIVNYLSTRYSITIASTGIKESIRRMAHKSPSSDTFLHLVRGH